MDEFDQVLKKALEEKAPVGFTDNIMDKLVAEDQKQKVFSKTPILGKGFIFIFLSLFVLGVIYVSNLEGSVESKYAISKYIESILSGIQFEFEPSVKMLVFSIAALCVFLIADYIFRSRKMLQI